MSGPKILLIKPKRIGDTLLLTPTISALTKTNNLSVDVVIHRRSVEILSEFTDRIHRIWAVDGNFPEQKLTEDELLAIKYDYAIELSGQPYAIQVLLSCDCDPTRKFYSRLYEIPENRICNDELLKRGGARPLPQEKWKAEHAVRRDWLAVGEALGLRAAQDLRLTYPLKPAVLSKRERTVHGRLAVFQPFTSDKGKTRRWPIERWRTLAQQLLGQGKVAQIVIHHGPDQSERVSAEEIASGIENCEPASKILSFPEHAALVKGAAICVTCNSAPMHLAAAVQTTPIVAVWGDGNSPIDVWHPWCEKFSIVCRNEIFSANQVCIRNIPRDYQEGPICDNTPERVFEAIERLLEPQNGAEASL